MISFLQYLNESRALNEANAAGSKFERKIADNINKWIKQNKLQNKFKASRFQNITEEEGNRDEDYSDVIVEDLETGNKFFIECKQNGNDNVITTQFDIQEDYSLVPVKDKSREEVDDEILIQLASDIQQNAEYQKFIQFMQEETDWVRGGLCPADFYFNKQEINDKDLHSMIKSYNKMVKNGEVEADNKPFDGKLIRESTRNMLAVALMWRLYDKNNTWDICHIEEIPYFGDLIRKHYSEDKAAPAKYLQLGNFGVYSLDQADNPLNIDCQVFPQEVYGRYDMKFTPRFGTGSMYITPRSKMTSELPDSCSFDDEDRFPTVI